MLLLGASAAAPPERFGAPAAELFVTAAGLARLEAGTAPRRLDARPPAAYAAGHLPGALACEIAPALIEKGVAAVAARLGGCGLTGEEPVVLYGDGQSYDRVGRLFWLLEWAGQRDVRVLDGGVQAWQAAGGRLEARRVPARSARFAASPRPSAAADPRWLAGVAGDHGVEVLDLRDRSGWVGSDLAAPARYAAGHIPQGLPFDFFALLPGDDTWPDRLRVTGAVGRLGPRPGTRIDLRGTLVLYGAGPEDSHPGLGYLLLRAIGADVRVLAGGFAAWTGAGGAVVRIVTAAELKDLLVRDNPGLARDVRPRHLLLFDLRTPGTASHGRLPGATAVPAERLAAELGPAVERGWPGVDRGRSPVAFYCYDRRCIRSREGCARAARAGFHTILWFRDGIEGWQAAGYPVVSGSDEPAEPAGAG